MLDQPLDMPAGQMVVGRSEALPADGIFDAVALAPVPALPPELPMDWEPQTFGEMLQALSNFDLAITTLKIDPAKLIPDLRGKVDGIKMVIEQLKREEAGCRVIAKPWNNAATSLKKNHKGLKAYVEYWMKREKFEVVPGNLYEAKLKNNPAHLQMLKGTPDVFDFQAYPEYVKPVRGYCWDEARIEADLLSGKLVFPDAEHPPFAKIVVEQHVEFPIKKPPMLEKAAAKRRSKKP